MEYPKRKETRLKEHDYAAPGYYFVTICTAVRNRNVLCTVHPLYYNVGGGLCAAPPVHLTDIGRVVESSILKIPELTPGVEVDLYTIMPDHLHILLILTGRHGGRPLHSIIGRFKSYTDHYYRTHIPKYGPYLWQEGYYEHVIRNDADLQETRQYIQNNPLKLSELIKE